jgi:hypothetical protein
LIYVKASRFSGWLSDILETVFQLSGANTQRFLALSTAGSQALVDVADRCQSLIELAQNTMAFRAINFRSAFGETFD